jgi:hypothetical protein
VTLGIRTHCPYGIRGCWAEIRDGLERPEEITSICKEPDTRTDTCEVRMRENWVPDPDMFAKNFTNMHIGVDVRGVEITVDGSLQLLDTNLVLRLVGTDTPLYLAPLTRKVQWDIKRKQPEAPARAERQAFQRLARQFHGKTLRVRIVGPLKCGHNAQRVLEVRRFELVNGESHR